MVAARRAFCFFVSAMISPANPPATKNATLAGSSKAKHQDSPRRISLPPPMVQNTHDRRAACLWPSQPRRSQRDFRGSRLRKASTAWAISTPMLRMKDVPTTAAESMSDLPRSKSIKEDEHMHSQKKFGDRTRIDRDRCALATATCLQHPERPTWALRGWSRSAVIGPIKGGGSNHYERTR